MDQPQKTHKSLVTHKLGFIDELLMVSLGFLFDQAHPNACDYTPGFAQSVLTIGATTRQRQLGDD